MMPAGPYPAHLPPQPAFEYLSADELATQGRHLLRAVEGVVSDDPNGYIEPQWVCNPRERLLDLSVSVLGTLAPADGLWRAVPHNTPWQPGQLLQAFTPTHWNPYDWYAVAIASLHQQPTGYQAAGQPVYCYVCHDPTHANYWHFVVRFAQQPGSNIESV